MHVVVVAIITPAPDKIDLVRESLERFVPPVHDEEGCLLFALHEATDGAFVLLERWTSFEMLRAHVEGPAVRTMIEEVGEHLLVPPDVRVTHAIPLGDRAKGQVLV